MKALMLIVAALLMAGCASVPMASSDQDARAKTFAVAPGKANIYVYRNEMMGAAIKMPVILDGQVVGETSAKSYFALEVAPGRHTLASQSASNSVVDVVAQAGKNYFVWQEVKMGMLSAGSKLQLVDDATGRAAVADCSLIASAAGLSNVAGAVAPAPAASAAAAPAVEATGGATAPVAATAATAPAAAAPVAAPAAAPAGLGIQMPVYKQSPVAAGKPVARGKLEFEAESAAIASGCKTADGTRPAATLVDTGGGFEAFEIACAGKTMKVRCESFSCVVN